MSDQQATKKIVSRRGFVGGLTAATVGLFASGRAHFDYDQAEQSFIDKIVTKTREDLATSRFAPTRQEVYGLAEDLFNIDNATAIVTDNRGAKEKRPGVLGALFHPKHEVLAPQNIGYDAGIAVSIAELLQWISAPASGHFLKTGATPTMLMSVALNVYGGALLGYAVNEEVAARHPVLPSPDPAEAGETQQERLTRQQARMDDMIKALAQKHNKTPEETQLIIQTLIKHSLAEVGTYDWAKHYKWSQYSHHPKYPQGAGHGR